MDVCLNSNGLRYIIDEVMLGKGRDESSPFLYVDSSYRLFY